MVNPNTAPAEGQAKRIRPSPTRSAAGLFGVSAAAALYAVVLLVLSPHHQPSADSHYHFQIAYDIAHGQLVPDVGKSLPFTVLHDLPVDHYWGYHALLSPFARYPDKEVGMKIATVAFFALVFATLYVFLRARSVAYAWAWALLPGLFSTQDWRYLQLRGGQLALPLLYAMAYFAFFEARARLRRAALVGIAYVAMLSYHGGFVLLPFHVAGVAALALVRRDELWPGQRFEPLLTAGGIALGLTLNPYMDARASTWRFFWLHAGDMGRDTAHLYDDQPVAEFHGFPLIAAIGHPEWLILLAATLCAAAIVLRRALAKAVVADGAVALAGMALCGVALTLQAMRMREYAVPIAFSLFAVLAPRARESRAFAAAIALIIGIASALHLRPTLDLIATHLPTDQYHGARAILEANGDHPILNVAEADYCMLRWEWDGVVCVQALSRYFLLPNESVFRDVWEVHDRADVSPDMLAILTRFYDRGVRIVAAHRTAKMARYAESRPALLRPLFVSPVNGATLYAIDRATLDAAGRQGAP